MPRRRRVGGVAEFVSAAANLLVSGGVGTLYATSGTSVQMNVRRDTGAETVVLLSQTGGLAFPHDAKEQYAFQVMVDSTTISGARTTARAVFDLLHERVAEEIGGHDVLWLRAVTLPQAIPMGPSGGPDKERFQFSVNFDALLVKE